MGIPIPKINKKIHTMKKVLIAIALIISFSLSAQQDNPYDALNMSRHEIRLDASEIIIFPNLELNYEYVISKYSGAGIALSYSLDEEYDEYQKFSINPYYRQYFFNKKDFGARGLFVEGVLKIAGGEDYRFDDMQPAEDWFNVGAGLVVGQKWVSDNGFVFELQIGGGRYFNNDNGPEGFLKGGVLIGYRIF